MSRVAPARGRSGQRFKGIEEVVAYAVSHRTRVAILILLNQGAYSTGDIAHLIGEPLNKTAHHLKELVDGGAVEIAKTERRRNVQTHYYRAVSQPIYTKEQMRDIPQAERQMVVGFVLQALVAEALGALWMDKMSADPEVVVAWNRLNVDEQGRREVIEEQESHFERLCEIEAKTVNRLAGEKGESTTPHIVAVLGFERALKAPHRREQSAEID